jgi:hypothetical protein
LLPDGLFGVAECLPEFWQASGVLVLVNARRATSRFPAACEGNRASSLFDLPNNRVPLTRLGSI